MTRPIGESLIGKDSQLDKAVAELLAQLSAWQQVTSSACGDRQVDCEAAAGSRRNVAERPRRAARATGS